MRHRLVLSSCVLAILFIGGCASPRVIPESLEPSIDRRVTFSQLTATPESFKGRVVVFGGEVLKAKRLKDGTQIEVLQLDLDGDERPTSNRQRSQGRFLALQREFLDPATIGQGTKVTIVGEVSGAKTESLDEVQYRYPVLIVKHLHIWPARSPGFGQPSPGFSIGIGGGTGGRIGGGGGFGIGF